MLNNKLDRLEFLEASDDDGDADMSFLSQVRGQIEDLIDQARNLDLHDPKIEAFLKVLADKNKLPNNKVLVFSTFRHTLAYLDHHALAAGLRVGLIHGDIADDDRADLRRRFALSKDDPEVIDVLLSQRSAAKGWISSFATFSSTMTSHGTPCGSSSGSVALTVTARRVKPLPS
jgi:superfamily II DNA/RNA helicase